MDALLTPLPAAALAVVVLATTIAGASMALAAATVGAGSGTLPTTTAVPMPPPVTEEARALADTMALTAKGRALYFAHQPTIDDRTAFASHCPQPEAPDSYLLGCFSTTPRRIYVLRIERPELVRGMTVTAAHEMLHAAYSRLRSQQVAKLRPLLEWTYAANPDATLHAEVDSYPASQRLGELYARLGTEIAALPPALERHYAAYFADRSVVVAAAAAYRRVFADLDAQLAVLEGQLTAIAAEADGLRAQLDAADADADRLGAQIMALRAAGRLAESNELVDAANAAVVRTNTLVDEYNAVAARHDALVDEYNALALTSRELTEAVRPVSEGRAQPTPTRSL